MAQIDWLKTILAFDSYNRGYLPGIDFSTTPSNPGAPTSIFATRNFTNIGQYNILETTPNDPDNNTQPFQAAAYKAADGSIVISYRRADQ